jgi:hypothetical protein
MTTSDTNVVHEVASDAEPLVSVYITPVIKADPDGAKEDLHNTNARQRVTYASNPGKTDDVVKHADNSYPASQSTTNLNASQLEVLAAKIEVVSKRFTDTLNMLHANNPRLNKQGMFFHLSESWFLIHFAKEVDISDINFNGFELKVNEFSTTIAYTHP